MRTYLTLLITLAAVFCNAADDTSAFLKKGAEFYFLGQYDFAKEMLKQVPENDSQESGAASFYLASIAANEGDEAAYKFFDRALKFAPPSLRLPAALEFAKFADANKKYELAAKNLKELWVEYKSEDMLAWYYAKALWNTGKNDDAKIILTAMLSDGFSKKESVGSDMFVEAYLGKDTFSKDAGIDVEKLPQAAPAGIARMEVLKSKKMTQPQKEIGVLEQIVLAESDAKIDEAELVECLKKYSYAPFAWRGALALAKRNFEAKEYGKSAQYALDASKMAPPDLEHQIRPLIMRGDALRFEKKYDEARLSYLQLVMNYKTKGEVTAEALYKTGLCWYEQGEWATAHTYFERVFVGYFKFEYWASRAYYYDARALYSLGLRRDANATLAEYLRRAKERNTQIYKEAKEFYDKI